MDASTAPTGVATGPKGAATAPTGVAVPGGRRPEVRRAERWTARPPGSEPGREAAPCPPRAPFGGVVSRAQRAATTGGLPPWRGAADTPSAARVLRPSGRADRSRTVGVGGGVRVPPGEVLPWAATARAMTRGAGP
ncbi:hypothetical protein ACIGXF_14325 [Streptomyces sp. NPDC053086]|uniref:hypothetical protein n=1 Tax=unclassified Streptomyces TaxID=2593676 RepID=UPI0037CE6885